MTMDKLKNQLKELLILELKVNRDKVEALADDAPLFNDGLGLDSLDAVELVVIIQKHFQVQIANMDEGMAAFASLNNLATYVSEKEKH
jgi:acyl carrier protein